MATSPRDQYEQLCKILVTIRTLADVGDLLQWDQAVMMPGGAAEGRGKQMATIDSLIHEKATSKELGALIEGLWSLGEAKLLELFNRHEFANIRDARRSYLRQTKLTPEIVEKIGLLGSEGFHAWVKARETDNWDLFSPILEQWVSLKRQAAAMIDPSRPAYDVLIDEFERGLTTQRITEVFDALKQKLVPLIKKVLSAKKIDNSWLIEGKYDLKDQAEFSHKVSRQIGLSKDFSRIDVSTHPFSCTIGTQDLRITTRYSEGNFAEGLMGTIHETGHALYDMGRHNPDYHGLPVESYQSTATHESQSLLWERMVGLSRPFLEHYWPEIQEKFNVKDKRLDEAYKAFNVVTQGFIRVDSDELTYPLHIILRFEIERDLLSGVLKVADLPSVWNAKMKEYLDLDVPTNKLGVLQDTHWSSGAFGYFPTYTLGAIYACQLFYTMKSQLPDLDQSIAKGDFSPIKKWLNEKIHKSGSLHDSAEKLMTEVTGKPIDIDLFIEYLTKKYTAIYNL